MAISVMNEKDKRNSIVTIRVTKKEKEMLERKASLSQESLSLYMLNCGMAGVERQRKKEQRRIEKLVKISDIINEYDRYLRDNNNLSREIIQNTLNRLKKEVQELWEN